ncbi:hypothetical protein TSH7_02760 [Azospirillum sp. TSH7]|uniref:hypothetical protein n=1 Tax=unclassified Azospirillum TaxID=2630922 RepID=UPI000D60FC78|nr:MULTISPECIES: hypothetical protein [unclassified Azospirillum]PWC67018.1 hypothetical protein TSH20_13420 [Azospirillum sp. TSH20]PWC68155.1 hypothetical protein TSH7_02760 [Azospirillum sp. TSH7]
MTAEPRWACRFASEREAEEVRLLAALVANFTNTTVGTTVHVALRAHAEQRLGRELVGAILQAGKQLRKDAPGRS